MNQISSSIKLSEYFNPSSVKNTPAFKECETLLSASIFYQYLASFLSTFSQSSLESLTKREVCKIFEMTHADQIINHLTDQLIDKIRHNPSSIKLGNNPLFKALSTMTATKQKTSVLELQDKNGDTLLMNAVIADSIHVVDTLLSAGVDVNIQNKQGDTPLMYATYTYEALAVKKLLDAGADVNNRNNLGETPLMYAMYDDDDLAVKKLLEAGADVNAKDNQGKTALMKASGAYYGCLLIEALLDAGADVNAKDNQGWTPLAIADFHRKNLVIKQLLEAGANPNIKNNEGQTALDIARNHNSAGIISALKKHKKK